MWTVLGLAVVVAFLWVAVVDRHPKLEAAIGWPISIAAMLALISGLALLLYLLLLPVVTALR